MRLAFITHNYPIDTSERSNAGIFVYDLANQLSVSGHKVYVFVINSAVRKTRVFNHGGLRVYYLNEGSLKKSLGGIKPYNPIDIARVINLFRESETALLKKMSELEIDFCIACWAIPSGILAKLVCDKLSIPYGIWALGSDIYVYGKYPIFKQLVKKTISNAKILFADGVQLSKIVEDMAKKKCFFLPSATKIESSIELKIPIDKNLRNFVFLGRMEKVKGPDILISAMSFIPQDKKYHLYMLGGGKLFEDLQRKVIDLDLEEKISFLGNVDDKNLIYSYLKNADFTIIPSRSDSIPLVLSESVKAGTPVIVSNVGDMPYLIKKYKVGETFPTENAIKLSKVILQKIINKKYKDKKFLEFRKIFDIKTIGDRLVDYLEHL